MSPDQEFLTKLVQGLVEFPDKVRVERQVDEMGVLLTLHVAPGDMGKVIGRSGNTAKAIRTLLRVYGMKNQARINMKVNDPPGTQYHAAHGTDKPVAEVEGTYEELKDDLSRSN